MTPYELRFEIFKQAYNFAIDRFSMETNKLEFLKQNESSHNPVSMEYPEFPSYEEIEALADKINNFVSSK